MGVNERYRGKGIGNALLEENEKYAEKEGLSSVTVKVYNVSQEMQDLLKWRGYEISEVEKSESDSKYDAVNFELGIKK